VDVVRGLTIAFMIMVNDNGGEGSWRPLNHAAWNGLTPTDVVFPTFVFLVGVSVVLAFEARLAKGVSRARLARHTVQRAAVLVVLGIVVNGFPFFRPEDLRFYGVLQRIAVCYLVVGLFYLGDRRSWTKVAALAAALVGYWALLRWVPVPGLGVPGRGVPFLDVDRNLVSWIDRHVFPHHLFLYEPDHDGRDPEGLLSDLPAVGTALMGVLTGIWLRSRRSVPAKTLGLLGGSAASLLLGYAWSLGFPLNKNLWTSSFVLVTGGWSLAVLALVFWAVEQRGMRAGWTWPWLVLGSNAIAAYLFSELAPSALGLIPVHDGDDVVDVQAWLMRHVFTQVLPTGWAQFAWSVAFTAFCFVPVWILYRRRIFLKV
jgi:predicted acyltransferase